MASQDPDDWAPSASFENLRTRSEIISRIRAYLDERDILEVETPALSVAATTDPSLHSFVTRDRMQGTDAPPLYLHTSPEFPMKRLLAAGSGSIYQICKVFRQAEQGRLHNQEFTILEWYRPGYDHHRLMEELAELMRVVLDGFIELNAEQYWTYREMFQQLLKLDPYNTTPESVRDWVVEKGVQPPIGLALDRLDPWLDYLLTHFIEPALPEGMVFVYDYPESQAALARIRPDSPTVAERFELYLNGVELANGFHELADANEQRKRIERELSRRREDGLEQVPIDQYFLTALEAGLPDCAGVALGIDRLVMIATDAYSIEEVITFPGNLA